MNHQQALGERAAPDPRDPNPTCTAELIDPNRYLADDVTWTTYLCPECLVCIQTVGGAPHWWNGIVDPSPSRAAHIEQLRATRKAGVR